MEEFLRDLAVAIVSSAVTALVEATAEALKDRTSLKHGKHEKRS